MQADDWYDPSMKCFGMMMDGRAQVTGIRKRGHDATLLLVSNSYSDVVDFTLPVSPGATAGCASRIQMRRMRPSLKTDIRAYDFEQRMARPFASDFFDLI